MQRQRTRTTVTKVIHNLSCSLNPNTPAIFPLHTSLLYQSALPSHNRSYCWATIPICPNISFSRLPLIDHSFLQSRSRLPLHIHIEPCPFPETGTCLGTSYTRQRSRPTAQSQWFNIKTKPIIQLPNPETTSIKKKNLNHTNLLVCWYVGYQLLTVGGQSSTVNCISSASTSAPLPARSYHWWLAEHTTSLARITAMPHLVGLYFFKDQHRYSILLE